MHEPLWQVSVCVHALPSLQALPSGFAGFEHMPVAGLHVPATWHWSGAGQVTGFAPVHVPPWQVSVWVHAFPSLHAVPSDAVVCSHTLTASHVSVVQGLPSSQSAALVQLAQKPG
jgi:hypothetical protein